MRWVNRLPGLVVSFHLVQTLTGHGCFRAYLHERRRATTPYCLWCPEVVDDVRHTIFDWAETIALLGRRPAPEDTQGILCGEGSLCQLNCEQLRLNVKAEWESRRQCWTTMVERILKEKEDERRREAESRATEATIRGGNRGAGQRRGRRLRRATV